MEISIILLNYKTKRLLRQCLKGIMRFPPHVTYEIIVVDNGSNDGTVEMMRTEFPSLQCVGLPKNIGYPSGSNVGIRAAHGKYILFLNADVVVLEGSIDALHDYLCDHKQVAIAGPQLLNPDGGVQSSAYRFHQGLTPLYQRTPLGKTKKGKAEIDRFLMHDWDHQSVRAVDWLMSSCIMVRADVLASIGLFDERFFVYLADTDLARRVWLAGYEVHYTPSAKFIHYHRRQSADDWRAALVHAEDWLRYLRKWRGRPLPTRAA